MRRPSAQRESATGRSWSRPWAAKRPKRVPSGLIHDWIGAAFLPNATLKETLATVRDYRRYKDFYQPLIVDSRPLGRDGGGYRFSIVMVNRTLFSKTALHSECGDSYYQVDARRWYSVGHSNSVREIENYGQAAERELPPDEGSGYVWRLFSLSRFEERDGGVYVEREVIALSRDISIALRWLVEPVVNRLSRNSLSNSLLQTRHAVLSNLEASGQCGAGRTPSCHLSSFLDSGPE